MVRFVYGLDPRYPAAESIDLITLVDELGYDACNIADDPTARDPWLLAAAAARETRRVRLGFSATHVYLREPTLIAQALATARRVQRWPGGGGGQLRGPVNARCLSHHVAWRAAARPVAGGAGGHARLPRRWCRRPPGESFRYTGLATSARPIQQHQAISCSRENTLYIIEDVRRGASWPRLACAGDRSGLHHRCRR